MSDEELDYSIGGKRRRESGKAKVNRHEKEIAEKLGGFAQPASGALDHMKGDVKLDNFLLDSKETIHASIKVEGKDLTKICREAGEVNLHPGLYIKIEKIANTTPNEWVLIPAEIFATLAERVDDAD